MTDTVLSRTIASTATLKIANLNSADLLYTPIEERFERITRLARRALRAPVAAISLLNEDKQWFKSAAGWGISELPRSEAICRYTLEVNELLTIRDTLEDQRTARLAIVTGPPGFRSYAGYPLYDQDGSAFGTFCVFGMNPRALSSTDCQTLLDLAALAQREIVSDQWRDAHAALTTKLGVARREALIDPLTHLWNRRGASVILRGAFTSADEHGTPLTLAIIDVDNFKRINDTYGHPTGDEVLRRVASRLLTSVRGHDAVCRLGGDEFLVLMTDTDSSGANRATERIRAAVSATPLRTRNGSLVMSVSVGYTVRRPGNDLSLDAVLERADAALRKAKSTGRNCVHIAD